MSLMERDDDVDELELSESEDEDEVESDDEVEDPQPTGTQVGTEPPATTSVNTAPMVALPNNEADQSPTTSTTSTADSDLPVFTLTSTFNLATLDPTQPSGAQPTEPLAQPPEPIASNSEPTPSQSWTVVTRWTTATATSEATATSVNSSPFIATSVGNGAPIAAAESTVTEWEPAASSGFGPEWAEVRDYDGDGWPEEGPQPNMQSSPPPRQLNPTEEHLLIAAGAIGAFILFCFVGWISYRTMKRSNGRRPGLNGLNDALPWRRRGPEGNTWAENQMYTGQNAGPPPRYATPMGSMKGSLRYNHADNVYSSPDKMYSHPMANVMPVQAGSPNGTYQSGSQGDRAVANFLQQYALEHGSEGQTLRSHSSQPQHQQQQPMSEESYFVRPELARQPSIARSNATYDNPTYDQRLSPLPPPPPLQGVSRFSVTTTTLSSGFGDDDATVGHQSLHPAPPAAVLRQSSARSQRDEMNGDNNFAAPPSSASWVMRPEERPVERAPSDNGDDSMPPTRRETMYTATSEDRPARFRSVGSWVDQQRGRVKRADSRARERGDIPVMPALPGQMNYTHQTTYQ